MTQLLRGEIHTFHVEKCILSDMTAVYTALAGALNYYFFESVTRTHTDSAPASSRMTQLLRGEFYTFHVEKCIYRI